MSQKMVTVSMQNSEGNGFGDPWQILSSTFLKSSVFCYVELTFPHHGYVRSALEPPRLLRHESSFTPSHAGGLRREMADAENRELPVHAAQRDDGLADDHAGHD